MNCTVFIIILHYISSIAGCGNCVLQRYVLKVVAMDSGQPPRSSTANVTIHIVDVQSEVPPEWQFVGNQHIDDLTDVRVSEAARANTLITNENGRRLRATSTQAVQYFLSNTGPPELNGNRAFKIPSPNPFNDTSLMAIATTSYKLDASSLPSYVLRCRAFVSVCARLIVCGSK